jgi:hypothetical protein
MEGWINCSKYNNRFRAFIQFCTYDESNGGIQPLSNFLSEK